MLLIATTLGLSTATAHTRRIPEKCSARPAPVLCAVHTHRHAADTLRQRMGQHAIPYAWRAERYPTRRPRILAYWLHVHRRTLRHWHAYQAAPWLHGSFYQQAMCIHRYESIDWYDPGSPGGGMQFMQGTWDNRVVRGYEFAATPSAATPDQQLEAAYRLVQHDGDWHEWSTHSLCGL